MLAEKKIWCMEIQIVYSVSCQGIRLKVQRLAKRLSVRAGNPDSHKRKARYLRYASSHCGLFFFFWSCWCCWRAAAGNTTLTVPLTPLKVTHAHPLTFSCRRERMRCRVYVRGGKLCGCACVWVCERICVCVWGGGENREDGVAVKVVSCTGQKWVHAALDERCQGLICSAGFAHLPYLQTPLDKLFSGGFSAGIFFFF